MPSEHDITIYWGNKSAYDRFKIALEIQDAVNPRAIARELVKVVDAAANAGNGTQGICDDPAVILLVNKLESMVRSESRFSAAYAACGEFSGKR